MIGGTRENDITVRVMQDRNAELVRGLRGAGEALGFAVHRIDILEREVALLRTLVSVVTGVDR
jgi:hypothetical protein